jgi:DNA-binding LacI/PurR family transcriptional regulator
MAATMKDVAKLAGVSLGTVSNFVNKKSYVTDVNKKKISKAIEELDYTINFTARSLKTNSFDTIGILVPNLGNVYITRVTNQIETSLREQGFKAIVVSYHSDISQEKELFQYFSTRVDGIIYVPSVYHKIEQEVINIANRIPVVVFDDYVEDFECDIVIVSNDEVSDKAVTDLLNKGLKNVALVVGPDGIYTSKQRLLGYNRAHERLLIPVNPELVEYCDYSRNSAIDSCNKLLNEHPEIDGFFVCGYRMTLGVLSVLQERNLTFKIPVVGYDTEDIAPIIEYPFSYVHQPFEETAQLVSKLIVRRVKGDKEGFPTFIKLDAEIESNGGC